MANWCNVRLSVFGTPAEIQTFRKAAGALRGRIDTKRSSVFLEEMEIGEGGDLEARGESAFHRRFRRAEYVFQGRNTDHLDHFVAVSRRYPRLAFVVAYSDPNADDHGSHFVAYGRSRSWRLPRRTHESLARRVYREHGCVDERGRIDYDHESSDMADWDVLFALMDIAAVKWDAIVLEFLQRSPTPRTRGMTAARRRQRQ